MGSKDVLPEVTHSQIWVEDLRISSHLDRYILGISKQLSIEFDDQTWSKTLAGAARRYDRGTGDLGTSEATANIYGSGEHAMRIGCRKPMMMTMSQAERLAFLKRSLARVTGPMEGEDRREFHRETLWLAK